MRNRITASTTVRCVELYCCCAVRLIKCNGRAKKTRPLHNVLTINTQEENQRFRTIMEMCKRVRDAAFFFIIMLVTFAATLLKPQKYVSSRTIQKCVEHVSTST